MTAPKVDGAPEAEVRRAKHLPLVGKMALPDLVPARMVNEVLFCERLLYLEWAQGEWADNAFTLDGRAVHGRTDEKRGDLPAPSNGTDDDAVDEPEGPPYKATSVELSSARLGVIAKIDLVEEGENGEVIPVEYKRGRAPEIDEGAYLPERAQVAAQVMLLREHGYRVPYGSLYFAKSKRRVRIEVTPDLEAIVLGAVARARELVDKGEMPPPLTSSPKCVSGA